MAPYPRNRWERMVLALGKDSARVAGLCCSIKIHTFLHTLIMRHASLREAAL
jgi:hypothetical protein